MILDSGIVYICDLENQAEEGLMPDLRLVIKDRLWYGERTVGFSRQYAAMGANARIDLLIRTHYCPAAVIGMFAVLGNGSQFRISNAQTVWEDGLRFTDLSLTRLEEFYALV